VLLFYALELPASLAGGAESHIFGPLSDYASLFQFVFLLPLLWALPQLYSSRQRSLSAVAVSLGVIGSFMGAIAQALLVTRVIEFEVNLPFVLAALASIGGWIFLASRRGQAEGFLSARLARLGEFTGASLALVMGLVLAIVLIAALNFGAIANLGAFVQHNVALIGAAIVLVIPGGVAYFLGVPIWLIGLGHRLLSVPVRSERSDQQRAAVPVR
jgi:hypothetical protein